MSSRTGQLIVTTIVATVAALIALAMQSSLNEGLRQDLFWPPSRRSAPFLGAIATFVMVVVVLCFMHSSSSSEHHVSKKRRLIMAQLTQAMRWDEKDSFVEHENGEKKEDKKEEKRPPETPALFEMLYDDVEEQHVTQYGISADSTEYKAVLALFRERLPLDMAEAARCTRLARGLPEAGDVDHNDDLKRVVLFKDGMKLRELVDLYDKKIRYNFGEMMPRSEFKKIRACYHNLERDLRQGGYRMLLNLLKPHLPLYCLAILLMAFDSSVGAANWHGIATLLDGIDAGTMSLEEVKGIFMQTYAKFVLCVGAHLTAWAFTHSLTGRFSNSVRGEVLRGVLRQDTLFFDVYPSGVIQERLNHDAHDLASKCFHLPLDAVHHVLLIVSNAYAVYCMNKELLWVCIAPIPVIVIVQRLFIGWMKRMHARGRKIAERVVANTNEMIKELRTVRSFAMEGEEADTYQVNSQYKTEIEEKAHLVHHCLFIAPLVLLFIFTRIYATYMGGTFVASKLITVGMAVQVGNAADHLQHCMRHITEAVPEFFKVLGPVGRVCEAINSRPTIEPYPGAPPKLTTPLVGRIDFVSVDFTFPSEPQKQILHGLSFEAKPGEKVAFVGATGCGKSTAIQLIQRFYTQSSGEVLIDGIPIEQYDVHHLRRSISVVAQDTVLFSTTVRENITYGLPRKHRDALTDAEIEEACRKANAWDFINGFPRKLETFCGERGVKLSGGQKQRLAIARAIIRKPIICLLDEATSALDSSSERVVQACLDEMIGANSAGCTIMIAHRLSTVKNCDQILALDKGHVLEKGSHDELLEIEIQKDEHGKTVHGLYRELWETQHGKTDAEKEKAAKEREAAHAVEVAQLTAELAKLRERVNGEKRNQASVTLTRTPSVQSDLTSDSTSSDGER